MKNDKFDFNMKKYLFVLFPLILLSCNFTTVKGTVETYGNVEDFPLHISYRVKNSQGFSGCDVKTDKNNSFSVKIDENDIIDLTIDVSPDFPIWQYSHPENTLTSPKIIYGSFDSFIISKHKIETNTIFIYNEIELTDYPTERNDSANLEIVWTNNIPNVDFYSLFFKSVDNNKSFSIIGIKDNRISLPDSLFVGFTDYDDILGNVESDQLMITESIIAEGLYSVAVSAYKINNDRTEFFRVGSTGNYYPAKYVVYVAGLP